MKKIILALAILLAQFSYANAQREPDILVCAQGKCMSASNLGDGVYLIESSNDLGQIAGSVAFTINGKIVGHGSPTMGAPTGTRFSLYTRGDPDIWPTGWYIEVRENVVFLPTIN